MSATGGSTRYDGRRLGQPDLGSRAGGIAFLRPAIDGQWSKSVHDPAAPAFDSLDEYRVASSEWRIYEIVAEVPKDAVVISYGLAGDGAAWLDAVSLDVI